MENDASSAGVRHGGLFSTTEIRILICYILSTINAPVPANMLANLLHYEGIANAFEVSDAIVSLTSSGQLELADEKDDSYITTESGKNVAQELNSSLSITVRERAYKATLKMLTKFNNAKNTEFTVAQENGSTYITCSILDSNRPFMSVKLLVSDTFQANLIKERFLLNPAEVYKTVIDLLTK